jgi:hypothetical protein
MNFVKHFDCQVSSKYIHPERRYFKYTDGRTDKHGVANGRSCIVAEFDVGRGSE